MLRPSRDLLLGAAVLLVAEVELLLVDVDDRLDHQLATLLVLPAVALRRRAPLLSMAFVALGLVTDPLVGDAAVATPYLTILFLLGSLGWYAGPRTGLVGVAAVLGCGLAPDLLTGTAQPADVVVNAVLIVLPWVLLRGLRIATDRRVLAEVAADRTAREAVEAERRRIAQDLHDSMAHALTLITLHAGSARERTTDTGSADALAAIERSGREALADMHRYLGLLGPRDGEAPGLADIDDLVEGVRRGGLDVVLDVDTGTGDVPASVATTVYRVVQEGLTNVVRHSDAGRAEVRVLRRDGELVTEVRDDGRPQPSHVAGSGRGLDGLRRRLGLFGGRLSSDASPEGWRLEARIPLATEAP